MSRTSNPTRGCGTKKRDAFYLESEIMPGGGLHSWTWALGNGIDDIAPVAIPPRVMMECNPAASITEGSLVIGAYEPPEWNDALYRKIRSGMDGKELGLGDHVGADNYSAMSFAYETAAYGPSRRTTPQMAKRIGELIFRHGPFPVLFTHSRVPIFEDEWQRDRAMEIAVACRNTDWEGYPLRDACWRLEHWGMSDARNQDSGYGHYLVPLLEIIDALDCNWSEVQGFEPWHEARSFYNDVRWEEQVIGLSWFTRVTYTLPKDGDKVNNRIKEIPNLNIVDLDSLHD